LNRKTKNLWRLFSIMMNKLRSMKSIRFSLKSLKVSYKIWRVKNKQVKRRCINSMFKLNFSKSRSSSYK